MTKIAAELMEDGERQPSGFVMVPRTLTTEMLMAAERATLNGTCLTISDWLEVPSKSDLDDLGIPWPEMAYDRSSIINDDFRALIIRTLWNAMIAKAETASSTKK